MFEDIIGTDKKNVCKKCGSEDIEVSERTEIIYSWPYKWYRISITCNTCSNTYYISNTSEDTSEKE